MTDVAITPTPSPSDPQPAPPFPASPPVTPGWRTSEAWLTLLAILLGALPSSGLIDGSPLLIKLVGMGVALLASLGYTTNRTSLKRAHLAAHAQLTCAMFRAPAPTETPCALAA